MSHCKSKLFSKTFFLVMLEVFIFKFKQMVENYTEFAICFNKKSAN